MTQHTFLRTACHEDWRVASRALRALAGERVFCLTGSGDEPLGLLLDGPDSVVAVGLAPTNHLLRLKMAALAAFGPAEVAGFLGHRPAPALRDQMLGSLEPYMSEEAFAFWLEENAMVHHGVLYQGSWERWYCALAAAARWLRREDVAWLLGEATLEAQRSFAAEGWDRGWWRALLSALGSRLALGLWLPAPVARAAAGWGQHWHARALAALDRHPVRSSFAWWLALKGRFGDQDLPPLLDPSAHGPLRQGLGALTVVDAAPARWLGQAPLHSFTRVSLSLHPGDVDDAGFAALLAGAAHAAAPEARFLLRQAGPARPIPPALASVFVREPLLETLLAQEDRGIVHQVMAGRIVLP